MLYALKQGPVERQIIIQAIRERRPIPDSIKNAPSLLPGLELYFVAYEELVSFQTINPERPPILWADVHEYAKFHDFSNDQREALMFHIVALETVSIQHKQEQAKKGARRGNKSKSAIAAHSKAKSQYRAKR